MQPNEDRVGIPDVNDSRASRRIDAVKQCSTAIFTMGGP